MFENIKKSDDWIKVELLNKGWSKDVKYHVYEKNKKEYLLRISDIPLFDKKKRQFDKTLITMTFFDVKIVLSGVDPKVIYPDGCTMFINVTNGLVIT